MTYIPDWNSVESTNRASDLLFWIGIAALFILVVSEVGSHVYGKRAAALQASTVLQMQRGRRLAIEQVAKLVRLLSAVPKTSQPIELDALLSDSEAILLARQIKDAFTRAGFEVNGVVETMLVSSQGEGIQVRQRRVGDPIGVGTREALKAVGLECELVAEPDLPERTLYIWVSHRAYSP